MGTVDMSRKNNRTAIYIILGLAFGVVLALCAGAVTGALKVDQPIVPEVAKTTATPKASAISSPAATKTSPAPPAPKVWTDGVYKVGAEIPAGSYVTKAGTYCYWARLSSDSGSVDAILANDNLNPGERGRVGIQKTDKFVEFSGGCSWSRA